MNTAANTANTTHPAMAIALAEAGLAKLPATPTSMERLWRAIKDADPARGVTHADLARRLSGIPAGTISSRVSTLLARGMVYVTRTTAAGGRHVQHYATDMDTFELLPLLRPPVPRPRKEKKEKEAQPVTKAPEVATPVNPTGLPLAAPAPVRVTIANHAEFIDTLTVAEARALYTTLHRMFGGN